MTKVVINKCYGGFGLSKKACEAYAHKRGLTTGEWNAAWGFYENGDFYDREIPRDDPLLIALVEEMGKDANGNYSDLQIIDIPEGVAWTIEEYDGNEWVAEVHRRW